MSLYIPSGTPPIVNNTLARIERRLPYPGDVLVRVGQRVEPDDAVAKAFVPATPHIMNVAQALMIAPRDVPRAMRRELGNTVAQGDVLARASSIGGRVCVAPVGGQIARIDQETGYVVISPDPQAHELLAGVRGVVMELHPNRAVHIETPAVQVYGMFGTGPEQAGVLRLMVTDPSEPITDAMIDARSSYAILIGGSGITAAALRRAVQEQVRGIIVGGIDERELRAFLGESPLAAWRATAGSRALAAEGTATLTLVVTEGFGTRTMAAPVFDTLAEHDRQEALIEGHTSLRQPLRRPRIVVPISARASRAQLDASRPMLRPGATVRLLDDAHLGQIGRIRAISAAPRRLASHVRTPAVDVNLADGGVVTLPRTAVEVLT